MRMKAFRKLTALLLVTILVISSIPITAAAADAELQQDDDEAYYVNLPVTGTDTLDLTDKAAGFVLHVYDDGGAGGNYSDYCDGYLRVVASEDCVLRFSGSGSAESGCDYLRIYDGDSNTVIGSNKYDYNFTVGDVAHQS